MQVVEEVHGFRFAFLHKSRQDSVHATAFDFVPATPTKILGLQAFGVEPMPHDASGSGRNGLTQVVGIKVKATVLLVCVAKGWLVFSRPITFVPLTVLVTGGAVLTCGVDKLRLLKDDPLDRVLDVFIS